MFDFILLGPFIPQVLFHSNPYQQPPDVHRRWELVREVPIVFVFDGLPEESLVRLSDHSQGTLKPDFSRSFCFFIFLCHGIVFYPVLS